MSHEIYQSLLAAALGSLAASFLLIFGGQQLRRHSLFILVVCAVAAIIAELTVLPFQAGYDARRVLIGGLGGGLGGLVGLLLGNVFDSIGAERRFTFKLPLAVVGFFLGQAADFGSSEVGKGIFEVILPVPRPVSPANLSNQEIFAELTRQDHALSDRLRLEMEDRPDAVNAYLDWFRDEMAAAGAIGLRGPAIDDEVQRRGWEKLNDLILYLEEADVAAVMDRRFAVAQRMNDADPAFCPGSVGFVGRALPPELGEMVAADGLGLMIAAFANAGESLKATLFPDDFEAMTVEILVQLTDLHGPEVGLYTGDFVVGPEQATRYCAVEMSFLRALQAMEGGPFGLREEYYRTMMQTVATIAD